MTGEGGAVEVRDAATGRRVRPRLGGLGAPSQALAFSPDGGRLAVADYDGNLRVMDLETGDIRRPPRLTASRTTCPSVPTASCSRSGSATAAPSCATAARSGLSRPAPWQRRYGSLGSLLARRRGAGRHRHRGIHATLGRRHPPAQRRTPAGHEFDAINAEFSPDGRLLATSGIDGTAILWDVASRRALGTLPGPFGWASVRFTPDGRRLFLLRGTGAAQRFEVSPNAWSRHACRVAGRELTRAEWEESSPIRTTGGFASEERANGQTRRASGFQSGQYANGLLALRPVAHECDPRLLEPPVKLELLREHLGADPVAVVDQVLVALRKRHGDAVGELEALLLAHDVELVDEVVDAALACAARRRARCRTRR